MLALNTFITLFSFQGAASNLFSRSDRNARALVQALRFDLGGGYRTRTGDPLLAKQVLYQLSYTPVSWGLADNQAFFAFFLSRKKEGGGPKWTRTTDLTIISRAL